MIKYGEDIKFREGASLKSELLFNPDKNGWSRIVSIKELKMNSLGFGNGGSWIRRSSSFARKYKIRLYYSNERGNKIIGIKLVGYQDKPFIRSNISTEVRNFYKNQPCVYCGKKYILNEIDHKDGHDSTGTKIEDFQSVCADCNKIKRGYCGHCIKSNLRFDAREFNYSEGWIAGNSIYTKELGCIGCYWNDGNKFKNSFVLNK